MAESKGVCHEVRGPEFSPWSPHCRRRDLELPKLSSDFHKYHGSYVCSHVAAHLHTNNKWTKTSKWNRYFKGEWIHRRMISYTFRSRSSKRWLHLVTVLFTLPRWINLTVLLNRDQTDAPYSGFQVFKGSQSNSVRPCGTESKRTATVSSHRKCFTLVTLWVPTPAKRQELLHLNSLHCPSLERPEADSSV